ncbi:DUF4239 domain-containing protein [Ancylobacter sp. 6x-1]|uniref:DUF4239 domain-containing protein n=1 Tax=Ancylobacter crimeensis TaxID=2579147 RepID=A0ABT0DCJ8_9HYPH|nr:DUF4239 domain-containing protein [Ancylobacter crimeensis]MCK0197677.1 DUF4239 domain-containing protein [Ancylobacter crimeensis]
MSWTRLFVGELFPFFVVLAGMVPLFSGALIGWIALRFHVVRIFPRQDLQAAFLGAITLPFALFLAFMVNDIWSRETRYAQTVLQEVQKLDAMLDMTRVCAEPCDRVDEALGAYARALSVYEWDEGWVSPQPEVSKVFSGLVSAIAAVGADDKVPTYLRSGLLTGQTELRRLRTDRYFILHADLAPHRWIVVLVLGFLAQVALASLHVGKRGPLLLAMATFSLAFAVTFGYTVALAWPTVDESIIPSEELRRVLE